MAIWVMEMGGSGCSDGVDPLSFAHALIKLSRVKPLLIGCVLILRRSQHETKNTAITRTLYPT